MSPAPTDTSVQPTLAWTTNQDFPVGKGATVQEFVAVVGDSRYIIDVAPWGTLIAALVGGAAAGVIGAIVLTPLVGVIRVIRAELARDDFPGATVRLEPAVPPPVAEPVVI